MGELRGSPEKAAVAPAKKPYKELNLAEKVALIEMAEGNPGLSQAELARAFGIAKSNVCRVLKRRAEYVSVFRSETFSGARKRKLRESETRELNALLAAWLQDRVLRGRPVTGALLQAKARQIAPLLRPPLTAFTASNGWLHSFQRSYVSLAKPCLAPPKPKPKLTAALAAALHRGRSPPPPSTDENNNVIPHGRPEGYLSSRMANERDGVCVACVLSLLQI